MGNRIKNPLMWINYTVDMSVITWMAFYSADIRFANGQKLMVRMWMVSHCDGKDIWNF